MSGRDIHVVEQALVLVAVVTQELRLCPSGHWYAHTIWFRNKDIQPQPFRLQIHLPNNAGIQRIAPSSVAFGGAQHEYGRPT